MNTYVEINIYTASNERCLNVLSAIEPDNHSAPYGISIKMECINDTLVVQTTFSGTRLLTLRNTIDDILEHVSIAIKTVKVLSEYSQSK
ncbi:MAG: KEOPS complex subunit Pcc1 [Ignisphaera sp.]|uniref:KEOPS complex Pcc1-like subunit n=1 Tax=Ignisphaera aggregans TaxID=334771 RepID=A0A7C4D1K9_9CREN